MSDNVVWTQRDVGVLGVGSKGERPQVRVSASTLRAANLDVGDRVQIGATPNGRIIIEEADNE